MVAFALIGVLAVIGYVGIVIRTAWTLLMPNREFLPEGYEPSATPFERVTFENRRGLRLAGWAAIRPDAPGTIIFCHGIWANHREMESRAEALWNRGFSVMTFDFQGCGESEGRYTSLGFHEVEDLAAAVDYLAARSGTGPLGVVGNSMGGAVAILVAARDDRIRAVATDGAFAAAGKDLVGYAFHGVTGLPPALFQDAVVALCERFSNSRLDRIRPVESIPEIARRPVMLIHGIDDEIVPAADAPALYAAAGEPKSLWIVPNCAHVQSFHVQTEEYVRRVEEFFLAALSPPEI